MFVPVAWVSNISVPESRKIWFFQHLLYEILIMRMNMLTVPQLGKATTGLGQPSTGHRKEGTAEEEEGV